MKSELTKTLSSVGSISTLGSFLKATVSIIGGDTKDPNVDLKASQTEATLLIGNIANQAAKLLPEGEELPIQENDVDGKVKKMKPDTTTRRRILAFTTDQVFTSPVVEGLTSRVTVTIKTGHPLLENIKSGKVFVFQSSFISAIEGVNDLYSPIYSIEFMDKDGTIVPFDDKSNPIDCTFGFYKTKTIKDSD